MRVADEIHSTARNDGYEKNSTTNPLNRRTFAMTTRHLTRRSFLQTVSTAALATPNLISSSAWAASKKLLPSDRIVMGFIGVGTQGRGLLSGFLRSKETQVVAVCDVDTTRRENAKKTIEDHYAKQTDRGAYKGCTAYTD